MNRTRYVGRQIKSEFRDNVVVNFMALCSIVIGTIIAISFLPQSFNREDALFTSAVIMSVALMLPILMRIRSGVLGLLRVENVLLVGVVYWLLLDLLQSAYPLGNVSAEGVRVSFMMIGLFSSMIWLGAAGQSWSLPGIVKIIGARPIRTKSLTVLLMMSFFLGISKFVISSGFNFGLMIKGLGASRWDTPWARGDFGDSAAFLEHTQYFGYVVPSLCVLLAARVGWSNVRVLIGLLLSFIIVAFLAQSGGRRIIGVVLGAALVTWVVVRPRKVNAGVMVGVTMSIYVILLGLQEMLRFRNVGFSRLFSEAKPTLNVTHLHVDDNFLRLVQLVDFYPNQLEYLYYQPIFHALTLPIPRVLWSGKPTGSGIDLPGLLGREGVSFSVSIIGELYISFGWLAVAMGGLLIGRLSGMWNRLLLLGDASGSRGLLFGAGLMMLFGGLRSMQVLVQMSYMILGFLLLVSFLPRPRQLNRKGQPFSDAT